MDKESKGKIDTEKKERKERYRVNKRKNERGKYIKCKWSILEGRKRKMIKKCTQKNVTNKWKRWIDEEKKKKEIKKTGNV